MRGLQGQAVQPLETLEVRYKGKSIHDVLEMTVEEALEFFGNIPKIKRKLKTLYDVGLGYIKLGSAGDHPVGWGGAARWPSLGL